MTDKAPNIAITDAPTTDAPKRRGRPPGSKTGTGAAAGATSADVKKALASLDSAYSLIALGLMTVGLNKSALSWSESADELKKTNEDALKASPKLAKWIANAGSTGGSAAFVITHGMAFAGLAKVVSGELAERRAERAPLEGSEEAPAVQDTTIF